MKKKKNTGKEVDEENEKKITRRTLRLEARVTEQEYTQAAELAKTCGLSMSDYVHDNGCLTVKWKPCAA